MAMEEQQLTTKENIVEYFSEILVSLVPKTLIETELQQGKAEGVVTPNHSLPDTIPYRQHPQRILRSKSMLTGERVTE